MGVKYAKQTQFSGLWNNVNSIYTKDCEIIRHEEVTKKQSQFKPNYYKVYPKFIPEKCKLGFTTGEELLTWYITGDQFYHPEGCQFID